MKLKKFNLTKSFLLVFTFILMFSTFLYANDTLTSEVGISFIAGDGPTKPVDPENPDIVNPIDPPVFGNLAVVYASNFYFGEVTLSTNKIKQYINKHSVPNVQVVDIRGTGAGWTLQAALSPVADEEDDTKIIKGAKINIENNRPNSTASIDNSLTIRENVELTSDNTPTTVVSAEVDAGMGLWVNRFYPYLDEEGEDSYVNFEIPSGFVETGNYSGVVTWTLVNAPS